MPALTSSLQNQIRQALKQHAKAKLSRKLKVSAATIDRALAGKSVSPRTIARIQAGLNQTKPLDSEALSKLHEACRIIGADGVAANLQMSVESVYRMRRGDSVGKNLRQRMTDYLCPPAQEAPRPRPTGRFTTIEHKIGSLIELVQAQSEQLSQLRQENQVLAAQVKQLTEIWT